MIIELIPDMAIRGRKLEPVIMDMRRMSDRATLTGPFILKTCSNQAGTTTHHRQQLFRNLARDQRH
jgi:hypothetical protein